MTPRSISFLPIVLALYCAAAGAADPQVSKETRDQFAAISADPKVKQGLEFLKQDDAKTLEDQKAITVIPAPPFKEKVRAEYYLGRFVELGLKDTRIDQEGNVIGVWPGAGGGPKLVLSAHIDTVFPEGTDLAVREKDGKLYAPGIGDDARGLAEILSIVRAFKQTGIKTVGDIYFVGTVGEEGLGNLRGVRALFREHKDIDGFISLDAEGVHRIVYMATGSNRYRVIFRGPGGHSFSAFGQPSAIHAMGRAIAKIDELRPPKEPKTTFTVGTVKGGTSVNTIAAEAQMEVDIRSNDNTALQKFDALVQKAIKDAVADENKRWGSDKMTVEVVSVGNRPGGTQSYNSPMLQAAFLATRALQAEPSAGEASSTDSNLPISIGIPAVTLGRGIKSGATHTLEEWYDPTDAFRSTQRAFLAVLALVGVDGVARPMLPKRQARP